MPAHVFNVPQSYRTQQQTQQPPEERPARSKFRWFGHSIRLGSRSNSASGRLTKNDVEDDDASLLSRTSPPKSASTRASTAAGHSSHRLKHKSSGFQNNRPVSRTSSARLDDEDNNSLLSDPDTPSSSSSIHKFSRLRQQLSSPLGHNHSIRSSIASTVSSSVLSSAEDRLSSSTTSSLSVDEELFSPSDQIHSHSPRTADKKRLHQAPGVADDANATWLDDAHAEQHYERLHWRIQRVQADGNCLFRAISDQIYQKDIFHSEIRRRIVHYIDKDRGFFQPFVENEQKGCHEPIAAYSSRMKQDAQWGGNPELYAAARLFNVHIVVHQGPQRRLRIENGACGDDTKDETMMTTTTTTITSTTTKKNIKKSSKADPPPKELHLLYRNDHYDSLHDESSATTTTTELDHDGVSGTEVDNQETEDKKRKAVVFLGEETRVERVEMPHVVVRAPWKAVVRAGKVCSVSPPPQDQEPDQQQDDHEEQEQQQQPLEWDSDMTSDEEDEEEARGYGRGNQQDDDDDDVSSTPTLMVPVVPAVEVAVVHCPPPAELDGETSDNGELRVAKTTRVSFSRGRRVTKV